MHEYFKEHTGFGVLTTADTEGRVNAAVFSRPHCFEDGTVGFIMPDRLTHANLQRNGHAVFIFREDPTLGGGRYRGKRLYLSRLAEDDDQERIASLARRSYGDDRGDRHLVIFSVDRELSLVGDGERQPTSPAV